MRSTLDAFLESRAAVGLAMAVLIGFGQIAPFLTSSSVTILAYELLPEGTRAGLTWGTWALRALPVYAILFLGLLAVVVWLYRPARGSAPPLPASHPWSDSLALQRALLGSPSRPERVVSLVTLFLVVGFATHQLHGVQPVWIGVMALALPRYRWSSFQPRSGLAGRRRLRAADPARAVRQCAALARHGAVVSDRPRRPPRRCAMSAAGRTPGRVQHA